ncbi:hypothetical protein [Actinomadura livida]|uniref:Uncharacterized protein n=1 Tax=Actinomadura livida TaxID=79909 RepID=A0A7W7IDP5_9ACTN|nr:MULTISPECIES: hypothetical protein [Actinomadura]MBB4775179.1 hypothetical protein [Actinomadura catellatispora]GGT88399.1 hypothetical protein GCM10010208_08920 [Actinomadura livida]
MTGVREPGRDPEEPGRDPERDDAGPPGGRRRARGAPSGFTVTVTAALAFLLLFFTVPNLGAVWRAARADGASGTFTAERLSCVEHPGHESCSWYGTFMPAAGSEAHETSMYGAGRGDLSAGERVPAIDVGRPSRVYSVDGSREWIPTGLTLIAAAGLCVPLARRLLSRVRPSGRARRSGTPAG